MTTSPEINELAAAMAKAQAKMRPAIKDATNPAFRSKYADLTAVWTAARGPLTEAGLSVWQDVTLAERGVSVVTRIAHTSGQWVEFGPLTVPLAKQDAHGVGSATSYAKRYALSAAIGVVTDDDDDANAAVQSPVKAAKLTDSPAGFDAWLLDMEATAIEGSDALKAAWTKSSPAFRKYLTETDPAAWEKLKAKASRVAVSA